MFRDLLSHDVRPAPDRERDDRNAGQPAVVRGAAERRAGAAADHAAGTVDHPGRPVGSATQTVRLVAASADDHERPVGLGHGVRRVGRAGESSRDVYADSAGRGRAVARRLQRAWVGGHADGAGRQATPSRGDGDAGARHARAVARGLHLHVTRICWCNRRGLHRRHVHPLGGAVDAPVVRAGAPGQAHADPRNATAGLRRRARQSRRGTAGLARCPIGRIEIRMTLLPVIARELRAESRSAFTYWLRVAGGASLLGAGLIYFLGHGLGNMAGGKLFQLMHATLFVAIWIIALLMTADSISRERREGTLGLLFLTPLRPFEVVLAKGLAHGLRAAAVMLAAVPVLVVPFLMGGVGWREALAAVLIDFSALCWALAAGLFASSFNRTMTRSLVWAVICGLCAFVVLVHVHGAGLLRALMAGTAWQGLRRPGLEFW